MPLSPINSNGSATAGQSTIQGLVSEENKTQKTALENLNKGRAEGPKRKPPTRKVKELAGFDKTAVIETPKASVEETHKETDQSSGRNSPAFRQKLAGLVGHGKPSAPTRRIPADNSEVSFTSPSAPEAKDSISLPSSEETIEDPKTKKPAPRLASIETAKKTQATVNSKVLFAILGAIVALIASGACTLFMRMSRCCISKKGHTQKIT